MLDGVDLVNEVDKFFDDSSLSKNDSPKIIIVTGGNGAGKTTHIRENYSKGFVIINAEEIYRNVMIFDDFGEKSRMIVDPIGALIAERAVRERRNIVLEMLGDTIESIDPIINAMTLIGYKVDVNYINSDMEESYERHLKAVKEDRGYVPTYYSQDYHRLWILFAVSKAADNQ